MQFLKRTWVEIDTSALRHNFELMKSKAEGSKVIAVVKANAYGHSVKIVAPVLDKAGADSFAVSNLNEALELRNLGIEKPILILGYTPVEYARDLCDYKISQCVYSLDYAKELSAAAEKIFGFVRIHIKLDTGMSRIGFDCRNEKLAGLQDAITAATMPNLTLEGLFTHFAVSDRELDKDDGFTNEQYNRFVAAKKGFLAADLKPAVCHCSNSAAIINDNDKHLDAVRAGVALYGLAPSSDDNMQKGLTPVMTFKTVVSMVKTINKGDTVSYGRTFKAQKDMTVATLPVGYADGYHRTLSNKGYVLINGQKARVLGRVCMDQTVVDVTNIKNVKVGDEVELFGKSLHAHTLASLCDTINYELVCSVSARVPRVEK